MHKLTLDAPVLALSGVGKTRAAQLARLGINTVSDLVYYYPRAYERRGEVRLLSEADPDIKNSFILTVTTEVKTAQIKKGFTISKFRAFDDSGSIEIVFFNASFVKDVFHIGDTFRFFGKVNLQKNKIQLQNPKYEPLKEGTSLPDFVPIYPLTEGITSKFLDKLIHNALNDVVPLLSDPLPEHIRYRNDLPTLSYALKNIHFPETSTAFERSLNRLAFDEMLDFALAVSMCASNRETSGGITLSPCSVKPVLDLLPYELTNAQKNAINDIYRDMVRQDLNAKVPPMARILVGDVGSGKTICAVIAMYIAVKSGYQAALMAPTEILARQHYDDISSLLSSLGIKVELLLGQTTQKEKKRIYDSLKDKTTDIVIGTHALISDKVEFDSLALVITDEQHRFGVAQRALLKEKSKSAHLLVMSATPIPRSLALAMYGDLDISRINEMPKGRMRVDTFVVNESYRDRLNAFIQKQVLEGGQCYIVCPSIEKNEDEEYVYENGELASSYVRALDLKNTEEYTKDLRKSLPGIEIECLHGKMKSKEKEEIMSRFVSGATKVLVSTTVIEVGVNVPNASLMIVENAERFGLSQLHQLRGRVGRGKRKSYCVLVSDNQADSSRERLEIMRTTYDGYEIAEKDLLMRGPGDFFSQNNDNNLRQSGGFEFKIASICKDAKLFEKAFEVAKDIICIDKNLTLPEHALLLGKVKKLVVPNISNIS